VGAALLTGAASAHAQATSPAQGEAPTSVAVTDGTPAASTTAAGATEATATTGATAATIPIETQVRTPPAPPAGGHGHGGEHGWPMEITGQPGHGITARTADNRFAFTVRGRFMLRDTLTVPTSGTTTNEIAVRRARLVFSGHTFSPNIRYYMQLSLSNQDTESDLRLPLLDAYVDLTHLRDLNVRVGQFIVPFDRARVISSSSAQMVDRSPVVGELNLDRDVGVQLYSNDFLGLGNVLQYQLGIFGGEGRNRLVLPGQQVGFLYVGRIQVNPFGKFDDYVEGDLTRAPRPRLSIGLGGAYNQNTERERSTTGHVFTLGGFDYAHAEADMIFKWAGFSLQAEFLFREAVGTARRTQTMMDGTTVTESSRSALGYFVQAGYMFTEHLEASARWSDLRPISDVMGNDPTLRTSRELGGALSWYLQGHALKLQADYFYLFGDAFAQGRHQARLQMQASF
jgi:hypothetical protein